MQKFLVSLGLCVFIIGLTYAHGKTGNEKRGLRLLSYNIRHGQGMDSRIDLDRIAEVIALKNPDLVSLQEIDRNCQRSGNKDQAAELGKILGMEHRFARFMNFQGGKYGMAVLSRFPIKETIIHQLPEGAEPRCALEVRVDTKGICGIVSFFCIHNDWTKESIRLKQVSVILEKIKNIKNPVILAGDFNGEKSDASLKLFKMEGLKILDKLGDKTWPSVNPEVEIDFFIVQGFGKASYYSEVMDESLASDHRPIYAEIMFQAEKKSEEK